MLQPQFANGLEAEGFLVLRFDGNGKVCGLNTLLKLLLFVRNIGQKEPSIEIVRICIEHFLSHLARCVVSSPLCHDFTLEQLRSCIFYGLLWDAQ